MSLALIAFSPAGAQPKQGVSKTVFENDKIIVMDSVIKPGEGLPSADRSGAIYYYLSGSKVERTFADGTKETVTRKTGQSLVNTEKRPVFGGQHRHDDSACHQHQTEIGSFSRLSSPSRLAERLTAASLSHKGRAGDSPVLTASSAAPAARSGSRAG